MAPQLTTATFVASHGLQTWALQVRTRIARQSEMQSLHEMITVQGDQWLDAYFEELVRAGPQLGGIAEIVKTPGKNRKATRTATANVAAKNAKLAAVNKNADKENAIPTPQKAAKKSTRFQRALMAVKDNEVEQPPLVVLTPVRKGSKAKKALQEMVDVPSPSSSPAKETVDETPVKPVRAAKGKAVRGKKGKTAAKKGAVPESDPPAEPGAEQAAVEQTAPVIVRDYAQDLLSDAASVEESLAQTPSEASPVHAPASPTPRKTASPIRPKISPLKMSPAVLRHATASNDIFPPSTPVEESPAPAPTSPTPRKRASPIRPAISPLKITPHKAVSSSQQVDEETLPEVDEVDNDLVLAKEEDEQPEPAPPVPEAASLSIIREDEEASPPPTSQETAPAPSQEDPAPSSKQNAEPKISQPSLDEFATAPLPTRPPRITLGVAPSNGPAGPPRASHANVGPPPVQLQRASVGLRSSWLSKALREDHALSSSSSAAAAPGVAPPPGVQKTASQPVAAGTKRKSSEPEAPAQSTSMPLEVVDEEPAMKIRKILPSSDKPETTQQSKQEKEKEQKDAPKALRPEPPAGVDPDSEEEEEKGILDRVRGKVEGLLVRSADKDHKDHKPAPTAQDTEPSKSKQAADETGESESSFSSLRKLTSRLSVSDLVSVFERRVSGTGVEQTTAAAAAAAVPGRESAEPVAAKVQEEGIVARKAEEKGLEMLESTTPSHSPPRPTQHAKVTVEPSIVPSVPPAAPKPGTAFAWAAASPTRAATASQEPQAASQSTQSSTSTYVAESQDLFGIPGTFTQTQETAVASQTSNAGAEVPKAGLPQPSRTNSADDADVVEELINGFEHGKQQAKASAKVGEERYLFEGSGETSMFAAYDSSKKAGADGSVLGQSSNLGASTATSVMLANSTASQLPTSNSAQGLFAQAGAFVSKALGMSTSTGPGAKVNKPAAGGQPVKSLQLAAAAAKKEQMEKDRKAQRAKEIEDRKLALAQRKLEEEKSREEEIRKAKVAELERRKREREEASAASRARLYKTKVSSDDESNKKRKLNTETERKPVQLKKAPSQDTLRKGMKTPTPGAGPSTVVKTGKPGGAPSKGTNASGSQLQKSSASTRPTLAAPSADSTMAIDPPVAKPAAVPAMDLPQPGPSALKGGAVRTSVMTTTKTTSTTGAVRQSKVKESLSDGRQPLQTVQQAMQARAQAQMQAAQAQVEEQARLASEQIVLPDIASEYSDSDDENRVRTYVIPNWANSPELRNQLQAQSSINPDDIFGAIRPLHMDEIFRTRQSRFRARTSSANWVGSDRLTPAEELEYARRMGFRGL